MVPAHLVCVSGDAALDLFGNGLIMTCLLSLLIQPFTAVAVRVYVKVLTELFVAVGTVLGFRGTPA